MYIIRITQYQPLYVSLYNIDYGLKLQTEIIFIAFPLLFTIKPTASHIIPYPRTHPAIHPYV